MVNVDAKRTSAWPRLSRSAGDDSELYTACEDCDFIWTTQQLEYFRRQWNAGVGIQQIAEYFDRDADELIILAIDQARQGEIQPRIGALLGTIGKS